MPSARSYALCAVVLGFVATNAVSVRARADAPAGCSGLPFVIEGTLDPLWITALASSCDALRTRVDLDSDTRLALHAFGDELVIEATLSDGRRAVRHVTTPLALGRVVEALLVLPSSSRAPATRELGAPPEPPTTPDDDQDDDQHGAGVDVAAIDDERPPPHADDLRAVHSPRAGSAPGAIGVRVAAGLMGRVTRDARLSFGLMTTGGVSMGAAEFAVLARWEPKEQVPDGAVAGFESSSFGVGVLFGGHARIGTLTELAADAELILVERVESAQIGTEEFGGSRTDLRIGANVRVELGSGSLRPFFGLDVEFSPVVVGRTVRIDAVLPPQTAWSAGLALGASWTGT